MSIDAGDDLLRHIRSYVRGRVPPNLESIVVELVGRSVVLIMTTPDFYNHLTYVQQLQRENWNLRQALIGYQQAERQRAQKARARKVAAAQKAAGAPKKAAPRKTAPKRPSPSNVRAFKQASSR